MDRFEQIEAAVSRHLAADLYNAATPEQRRCAIAMAERDIISQTGENIDKNSPVYFDAVSEQAIFLLLNIDKLHSPLNDVVSESIDGAGSVTYDRSRPGGPRLFSSRALELCASLARHTAVVVRG